jgi:hypothetical protein
MARPMRSSRTDALQQNESRCKLPACRQRHLKRTKMRRGRVTPQDAKAGFQLVSEKAGFQLASELGRNHSGTISKARRFAPAGLQLVVSSPNRGTDTADRRSIARRSNRNRSDAAKKAHRSGGMADPLLQTARLDRHRNRPAQGLVRR